MSWETQNRALIGCRRKREPVVAEALTAGLRRLAHSPSEKRTDVSVQRFAAPRRGGWQLLTVDDGLARILSLQMARDLNAPVEVFWVRAQYVEGLKPACTVDDRAWRVAPDGSISDLHIALDDWEVEHLDTDHPWHLVDMAVDEVLELWVPEREAQEPWQVWWSPPASTGDVKLDRLLAEMRRATSATLIDQDGRAALKVVTFDDAVSVSFLSEAHAAAVSAALEEHR